MAESRAEFYDRLAQIERQRAKLAKGSVRRLADDGLIHAYPSHDTPRFPLRNIIFVILAGLLFKAVLLTQLGQVTYEARVAKLAEGTIIEQGGAYLMQIDPATSWIADQINIYF